MLRELRESVPEGCISDLQFDEWSAGELIPADAEAVERHLESCARCCARTAELRRAGEQLFEVQPRFVGASVRSRSGSSTLGSGARARRISGWGWGAGGLALAAAAAYLIVTPSVLRSSGTGGEPGLAGSGTRSKGGDAFGFLVKRGDEVFAGTEMTEVRAGDRLRFFATTPQPQHLAVLSRDARGVVSEYFPGTGRSERIEAAPKSFLDSSVELDGTLGHEVLWAIFCDAPFDTAPFLRSLATTTEPSLPPGCSAQRRELMKVQP